MHPSENDACLSATKVDGKTCLSGRAQCREESSLVRASQLLRMTMMETTRCTLAVEGDGGDDSRQEMNQEEVSLNGQVQSPML